MWWAEGVSFGCTACGRCCVRRVPAASSPLSRGEVAHLAEALGVRPSNFRTQYTEKVLGHAGRRRLRTDPKTGHCVLLRPDGKCSVHQARPAACRTYPFWPENLSSPYEWAREAAVCEGIGGPWGDGASNLSESPRHLSRVSGADVERELLLEELRVAGMLEEEGWTHGEAAEHIAALRAMSPEEFDVESPPPPPRSVIFHERGLVVLETPVTSETSQEAQAEGWVTRSLHFEASIGLVQTEMRYHPARQEFDHRALSFGIHRAFHSLVVGRAASDLSAGILVLGGGGGALAMALSTAAAGGGPLARAGPVVVVEREPEVVHAAERFFGFRREALQPGGEASTAGIDGAAEQPACKLFVADAREFLERRPGAPRSFAAIFVDLAGRELPRGPIGLDEDSTSHSAFLAPAREFLVAPFAAQAAAAVSSSQGLVAWNVFVRAGGGLAALRAAAEAVHGAVAAVGDGSFRVAAAGPIVHEDGSAQWLLVAAAGELPDANGLSWVAWAELCSADL